MHFPPHIIDKSDTELQSYFPPDFTGYDSNPDDKVLLIVYIAENRALCLLCIVSVLALG